MFWRIFLTSAIFLFSMVPGLPAAVLDEIVEDFKPVEGYVIMPVDGEYLIDQDAAQGVSVGDIFSVVRPGEKIVHPVTNEVIGTLDESRGTLQVTRVKEGYSYAAPLGVDVEIARGEPVRRYRDLPATYWDYTGEGENFFAKLKAALPDLEWKEYGAAQVDRPAEPGSFTGTENGLYFLLSRDGLQVRDGRAQVIHSYPLPQGIAPGAGSSPPAQAPVAITAPAATLQTPVPSGAIESAPATSPIIRREKSAAEGILYGPDLEGVAVGLAVGDFDGEGRKEIATCFPHALKIARLVGEDWSPVAEIDLGLGQKAISIDEIDLDGDGKSEIFVTAADRGSLRSMWVGHTGGRYEILEREINWYLRAVHLPGEGRVLLGQRLGQNGDFSGTLFRVALAGGKLVEGEALDLPRQVTLYGFLPLVTAEGEALVADINEHDRLRILGPDGEALWEGQGHFGGSESFFQRIDPNLSPTSGDNLRLVFTQQRIEPGPAGEIVVPVNEGSRLFRRSRVFKQSHLKGMAWNGHTLVETWRTQPQDAYLADFRLADADNDGELELIQALVFSREGISRKGRSALSMYELK